MAIRKIIFFLFLILFSASICFAEEENTGYISGKWITKEHGPMTGGQVLLFNTAAGPPPSSNKYLRLPDAGTPVDEKGAFKTEVPAGNYYLVMRKRVNLESAGPPVEGDPQYYARLKNGEPKTFIVNAGEETNIGTITEAEPFKREKTVAKEGMTGIVGTVTDDHDQPVTGILVLAYETPKMQGRPLYASDETGADGKYFLNVIKEGTYYLRTRSHYGGGKPAEGEFMGIYGKTEVPDTVAVKNGEIRKGVNIQGTKFVDKLKSK